MALDAKYRPRRYEDVLGQEPIAEVLRQYVQTGAGFHQSYVFSGPYGSGKTTLGRILARALLCDSPVGGDPCDACPSCLAVLSDTSDAFVEFDAASNSSKEDLQALVENSQFETLSGKRRLYLIDESHRLSKHALDVLLKPLEEPDAQGNKQLVCIFCTTEPEKMAETVFSRCAPLFRVLVVDAPRIGGHLAKVATAEGISYEPEALTLLAEIARLHIRNALMDLGAVSRMGPVTVAAVQQFFGLDMNNMYVKLLQDLGEDLSSCLSLAEALALRAAPSSIYARLAEMAMYAFRLGLGGSVALPSYLPREALTAVGKRKGALCLAVARQFSARPTHASEAMLLCDVASLHQAPTIAAPASSLPAKVGSVEAVASPVVASAYLAGPAFRDRLHQVVEELSNVHRRPA